MLRSLDAYPHPLVKFFSLLFEPHIGVFSVYGEVVSYWNSISIHNKCLIGCCVDDLLKLKRQNIVRGAVEYIPHKTKDGRPETIRVPLNNTAKEIIAKYDDADREPLLPFISAQKYNDYIKECFKVAGLDRYVTVLNPQTRESEQKPLYEVASSHMARRTFVGNLYKQVKDPNLVGALSGHKEGSKAFARYRDIDEEMKTDLVKLLEK